MTYPPEHHLLSDLRITSCWVTEHECRFTAPFVPEVANASGSMSLGAIFAVADFAAASTAVGEADGDWAGTLDLSIRESAPVVEGPLVVSCEAVRAGGTLITIKAELFDAQGQESGGVLAGTGVGTFRRMRRDLEHNPKAPRGKDVGVSHTWAGPTSGFDTRVVDELGLVELGPGVLELEKSPYVTNSFGTVNGGTTGILICAGAESAVGTGFIATDVEVRYIGQAGTGPVRTMSEVLRVGEEHAVVDVTVVDMSNERRAIATATVTLTSDKWPTGTGK